MLGNVGQCGWMDVSLLLMPTNVLYNTNIFTYYIHGFKVHKILFNLIKIKSLLCTHYSRVLI